MFRPSSNPGHCYHHGIEGGSSRARLTTSVRRLLGPVQPYRVFPPSSCHGSNFPRLGTETPVLQRDQRNDEHSHDTPACYDFCFRRPRFCGQADLTAILFLPFRILVPGRIFIIGIRGTRMKIGRIALVGILATVALAMAFLSARSSSNNPAYAAALNADLALFRLFPFGSLDGKKVLDWDRRIWFIALAITLTLRLYLILK